MSGETWLPRRQAKLIIDSTEFPERKTKTRDWAGQLIHKTVPKSWLYAARVEDSRGMTVWSDNGGTVERLLADGFRVVTAVRILEHKGHTIESWHAVIERALAEAA